MLSLDGDPIVGEPARTVWDPVHFSDLRCMALSPAHFKASVAQRWESTKAMRIGTIVHHMALGPHRTKPLKCFDGLERKGNAWKDFAAENPGGELVTMTEWMEAKPIADAVLADPIAGPLIRGGRREVPLKWKDGAIECETDGLDLVGNGFIADLKRTSCTEPGGFARHAAKNLWHCQMAYYRRAAIANGIDVSKDVYLIGVEPEPPYAVTVMRLPEVTLLQGDKSCALWLEKLQMARENDHWPTYTQTIVDFDLPPWMGGDEDEA